MSNNHEAGDRDSQHEQLKATVEALLFATNGLTVEEIQKKTKLHKRDIEKVLDELEMDYLNDSKGVHIVKEGDVWKMSVKPEHTHDIKDLLPPEMPKGLIKTLAIVAAKKPIKQSTIIKIRGNKAYGHIKKLERIGFITSEKHGTTQMLDLTEKFFSYFSVEESELKKNVSSELKEKIEEIENAADETEKSAASKDGNAQ